MKQYMLYIKQSPTGLMYLGKFTRRSNNQKIERYTGSGVYWKSYLKKYGYKASDLKTFILLETDNYEELVDLGLFISKFFDIVNNKNFANLKLEEGDGFGKGENNPMRDTNQRLRMSGENNPMKRESVRKKNSESKIGIKRPDLAGSNHPMFGKKNPEHAEKISGDKNVKYWLNKKRSNDTKNKISNSLRGRKNPEHGPKVSKSVIQQDKITKEIIGLYTSMTEASEKTGIAVSSISQCCNGMRNSVYGFIFKIQIK